MSTQRERLARFPGPDSSVQCLKCKNPLEGESPQFQLWLPMTELHIVGMLCLPCMHLLVEFLTGQKLP